MDQGALLATAAGIGIVHTLLGPDHYVPFVAMSRARQWTLRRTLVICAACGVGHVGSSVLLGTLGIALGWAVGGMQSLEATRGQVAGWLLLGFGLAYFVWGLHRAARNQPHTHMHTHADGTVHAHPHSHHGEHAHVHVPPFAPADSDREAPLTPWVLFTIFVFGPCEPLIPLLMVPAATGHWRGVAAIVGVFGAATIGTMLLVVGLGWAGLTRISLGRLERYTHALAGAALAACGLAVTLGL